MIASVEGRGLSLASLTEAALCRQDLSGRGVSGRALLDDGRGPPLVDVASRAWVAAERDQLEGRNLLLLTERPLNAALALLTLDGLAGRMVIAPPELKPADLARVIADADIQAIVHDGQSDRWPSLNRPCVAIRPQGGGAGPRLADDLSGTEWVLFTSGTSGPPKMAVHTLAGLAHAMISPQSTVQDDVVWATFYDIRRFGGLQMLLRALTGGFSIQLVSPGEPMATILERWFEAKVTHISGTPSHWRSALMHASLGRLSPRYVRLSGEIADQAILDRLAAVFPNARIGHAYASTEAGVGFEVDDGREGFPISRLDSGGPVEMRIEDGTLRIRSPRTALRYLGDAAPSLADAQGFVDTGDLVEAFGERLRFVGRASGIINVGGLKVHPEEVEAVINRCPGVRMSRVKARRNAVLGAVVSAEVVSTELHRGEGEAGRALQAAILDLCRRELAPFKTPATLRFVDTLPLTAGGKLERRDA